jgi:hypothetical protein
MEGFEPHFTHAPRWNPSTSASLIHTSTPLEVFHVVGDMC